MKILAIPKDLPQGWDIADAIAEGATRETILEFIRGPAQEVNSAESRAPARAPSPEDGIWREHLIVRKSRVEDCRENVMLVLTHHPEMQGLVARDDFSGATRRMRKTPWGAMPGEWSSEDDRELGLWLAQKCGILIRTEGNLSAGVEMAAARAAFHPALDYLKSLKHDGERRLDAWLHDCLGVVESEYACLAGRYFIMSMVARVVQPGCQADHMIVLEGPQGRGKSSALRVLGGDYFSDAPFKVGDKDSFMQLSGVWLYEVSELDSFNRSETTAVKAFVSQITDRFREPYGRRVVSRPRQTVLAGTTNQDRYLRDMTGNRRFWPMMVGQIDIKKLAAWRDQLFAEAYLRVTDGERWWPSREEEQEHFHEQQDERIIEDPWVDVLERKLSEPDQLAREDFTASEVLAIIGVTSDKIDSGGQMAKRVQHCMTLLGWGKPVRLRRRDGTRPRVYMRPRAANHSDEAVSEVPL